MPFTVILSSLALPINLVHGSGFRNLAGVLLLLAILLPPILVALEMVRECLYVVGLFMYSLPETASCLLAWNSSFLDVPSLQVANTDCQCRS